MHGLVVCGEIFSVQDPNRCLDLSPYTDRSVYRIRSSVGRVDDSRPESHKRDTDDVLTVGDVDSCVCCAELASSSMETLM